MIASTLSRLQLEGEKAKAKSELALGHNVRQVLEPCVTGSELATLIQDGVVRINNVLSAELCDECLDLISQELDAAINAGGPMTIETGFGNVLSRDCRWDFYQRNEGPILESLKYMLENSLYPLPRLFIELFQNEDSSFHELSALVSDFGAKSQSIHPDTPFEDIAPLYTVFIALQDITEEMGGTIFLPGTNTEAHHAHHKSRSAKDDYENGSEYRRAVLKKTDCVVMDSRTLHCGASNTSGRRVLLYFTLRNPWYFGPAVPNGSKLEVLELFLSDFRQVAQPPQPAEHVEEEEAFTG